MTRPFALLSVSDKTGLADLAKAAAAAGYELLSTGGTARALREAGLEVTDVSDYTGFPEVMDGRVKTLHPRVHGGLLARRDVDAHVAAMREHGMRPIDLVVVNLYPFAETVRRPGVTRAEAVEQIDIGGPSMLRSAAKNHEAVTVVVDPADYAEVADALGRGEVPTGLRRRLAAKVYAHTAAYDATIAGWLAGQEEGGEAFPERLALAGERVAVLRYGENPHQAAAFYRLPTAPDGTLARAEVLGGKELSYNNILDLDAALALAREFPAAEGPFCAVLKHGNPCGSAQRGTAAEAFAAALACDPLSAFGSIVAFNVEVDAATAAAIATPGNFVEALLAPAYGPGALEALEKARFGKSLRILRTGPFEAGASGSSVRAVSGGLLVQDWDGPGAGDDEARWNVATARAPSDAERADLRFAWRLVKHVKSNAIVVCRDRRGIGIGAGQMSRVDSVRIAVEKAGDGAQGAVLGSDAFFPFADGPEAAAAAGITAIVQPGGSKRDDEVVAAADAAGMAMVLTGTRHFRH
ncbi:MAG: bifunctional phosphoribosylaminoimidazolecarboxamide formyltransferase/IMP cyclohydrolase [Planctomycetota bacterium]